jgi:M penetrans paralogue family 26
MAENSKFETPFEDPFENQVVVDPFIDDHFGKGQKPQGQAGGGANWTENLPDSTAVLVLGILSIIGSFCYGVVGLILGIIAIAMSSRPERLYQQSPDKYSPSSHSNLKAGKVCAIVGVCISGLFVLGLLLVFVLAF